MIGVQCAAGLEGMFELTRAYVKERKAFGKGKKISIHFEIK